MPLISGGKLSFAGEKIYDFISNALADVTRHMSGLS